MELTTAAANAGNGPQPGNRAPAPGELRLVQTFLNSRWDLERENQEKLVSPRALATWLLERGLVDRTARCTESDLNRVLDVREGLRAMLFVNNGASIDHAAVERLNRALHGQGVYVHLSTETAPDFRAPRRDLDGFLAVVATIVAVAQIDGRWSRMKACCGVDCGWVFYDHSRNQASSWCTMSVCGSRAKAREYRRRKRPAP